MGGSAHGEEEGTGGTRRWECQWKWKWKFQSVEFSLGECAWIRSVVAISDSDEGVGREEKEEPDL